MATKILVVGPVNGHLEKAFQKIEKLHSKTSFAFALVIGSLFAEQQSPEQIEALLAGKITVPLPTYFTVGDASLPISVQERLESSDDGEVCTNLFYLGRKGTLKTAEQIKIVFLGGKQVEQGRSATQALGKHDALFHENEARALQGANSAHILLTNTWPAGIENGSTIPESFESRSSSFSVSNLCATLKPRYHFSPFSAGCWKREPFLWPMDYSENAESQVTRFEALGSVEQKTSEWVSAFTLDPTQPASTDGAQRAIPFTNTTKRKRAALDTDPFRVHRFDNSGPRNRGGRNAKPPRNDPNDCFMCLGKPTFSSDMVVSIADESFVTSLRGPLSTPDHFPQLRSTGNLMIIPMYHAADETSHGTRAQAERESEFNEMTRYRHALQHMLRARANSSLGAVCWEVNRTGIRHFHWQWIACPQVMVGKGLVEAAFKVAAEKNQYERFQPCTPDALLPSRQSDYFRVWIWSANSVGSEENGTQNDENANSGTTTSPLDRADTLVSGVDEMSGIPPNTLETSMYFDLPQDQRFNIHFGRTVISGLLKLEHRIDWRSIPAEEGEEARDADAWKEDLTGFDFAMM